MSHLEQAVRAATMYYLQDETMEAIGASLGVSRSTVSRLLVTARQRGIVRISVDPVAKVSQTLSRQISARFRVNVHVVPVRQRMSELQRLDQVAAVTASLLADWITDGTTLGVAWGTTVGAIAEHLIPKELSDVRIVQLNGAAGTSTTGVMYAADLISTFAQAYNAKPYYFPVPAFFDYAETKAMMWRERSVQRVQEIQQEVDTALFGIGAPGASVPSHVYAGGYLEDVSLKQFQSEQIVGDVCTILLREDGSYRDISLNARASGPTPRELQRIRRRVCVVVGESKMRAAIAALNARVATDLVIDEQTARTLIKYLQEPRSSR